MNSIFLYLIFQIDFGCVFFLFFSSLNTYYVFVVIVVTGNVDDADAIITSEHIIISTKLENREKKIHMKLR